MMPRIRNGIMDDDLREKIVNAVDTPQFVGVDGQQVAQRPIKDIIEADQYLAAKAAQTNKRPGFGMSFQKIIPPGGG